MDGLWQRKISSIVVALLLAVLLGECIYFLQFGRFNIDEGMHLNAGRLLAIEHELPYRDFPFSQGPGAPLLYGTASALFGTSLLVGRAFSLAVSLLGVVCMVWFAGRISGRAARPLVVLLTLVNIPAVWTYAQVRTEPAAIALIIAASIALCFPKRSVLGWALAPSLLVWATSVRLTNVVPLLAACLLVAFQLRRSPRMLLGCFGIVGANGVLAAAPMLAFPTESFFHIVTAQLGRAERFNMGHYPFSTRFWFFVDPHTSFQPLLSLVVLPIYVIVREWRRGWRLRGLRIEDPASVLLLLIAMAALTYAPHLLFTIGFFHYFVTASVLLTLAIAIAIPMIAADLRRFRVLFFVGIGLFWGGAALHAMADIEKWVFPASRASAAFRELRSEMQNLSPARCTMMTFETHIAVETSCQVMPGLEYSHFSFFPEMPVHDAEAHGVLSRKLLQDRIARDRPEFVALTSRAIELIEGRTESSGTEMRTRRGELERIREAKARVRKDRPRPILDVMVGEYTPITRLKVPVGPVHSFWTTVYVYARSDLGVRPKDESPGARRRH